MSVNMSSERDSTESRGAIMQPTYLPWMGYFALMSEVDTFVLLDSVQFHKHSWQQRNRIKTPDGIQWLTVPVLTKGRFHQTVEQVEINPSMDFRRKHLKALEIVYHKAPHFAEYAPSIFEIIARPYTHLAELTIALIRHLAAELKISTRILRSSELGVDGSKAELLGNICQSVGVNHYISPPGAAAYLVTDRSLSARGIRLSYSDFTPKPYPQANGDFFPLASVVDALFQVGEKSRSLLEAGRGLLDGDTYHRRLLVNGTAQSIDEPMQ